MTIEEFGQSIKAKYPEYNDLPDAELGTKMLQKYPQYQDMVQQPQATPQAPQPKKSVGQRILDTGTAVAKFVGAEGISEQFGADIARATSAPDAKNFVEYPSMKKVVGSAIQTGANFIPGAGSGAGLATKIAVGAGTGYAFDVGSKLQANEANPYKPGIGTAVGASLPILGKIVGYVTDKGSAAASKKLEQLNLRLTPVEKQNLAKQGKDIADFLSKKKVIGSPGQRLAKVDTLYDDMENTVQGVVRSSGFTYPKAQLIDDLKKIPDEFIDDPELVDEAYRTTDKFIKILQDKYGDDLTGTEVNALKRAYMKRAFAKNATDVVSESRLAIGGKLKGILDTGIPALTPLNKEYGYIIASRRALQKALSRNQVGLIGQIVGTTASTLIGGAIGGPAGSAAGAVVGPLASKTLAGTGVRSTAGAGLQTLSQISKAVQKLPTDKFGNISKKALLNLLESGR